MNPSHINSDAQPSQPPHKRVAAEPRNSLHPADERRQQQQQDSAALRARARFARELEQYASDDDSDVAPPSALARGGALHVLFSSTPSFPSSALPASQLGTMSGASAAAAAAAIMNTLPTSAPPASDTTSDAFFFGDVTSHDDDHAGGNATSVQHHTLEQRNGPTRIGLSLLHRMHNDNKSSSSAAGASAPSSPTANFEVVHSYVPLSTGGFLSTASALDDAMEGHHVRVGDVLALRNAAASTAVRGASSPSSPSPPPPAPAAMKSAQSSSPAPSEPPAPASFNTTTNTSNNNNNTFSVAEAARKAMGHFTNAANFSADEQKYGRALAPDMVRLLFEVARVDRQSRSVEALFLDGTRAKLAFHQIRPAGYVERTMYAQWKADPSSRPVTKMHSGASSPTSVSAPGTHPASPVVAMPTADTAQPAEWWVIPRLLVRVATEGASDWYGKKCVVKAVRRHDNVVRLTEWQEGVDERRGSDTTTSTTTTAAQAAPETRELVGVDGLETVVPKKGGRALVVLGARKGEMCTVRSRVRGADGELTGVEVEMNRTKEVVTLQAEELCALAR